MPQLFDDDSALWKYVLKPLLCPELEEGNSCADLSTHNDDVPLLPFLRVIRTSMMATATCTIQPRPDVFLGLFRGITPQNQEDDTNVSRRGLDRRLRPLLLVESITVENVFCRAVEALANVMRRFRHLTSVSIDCFDRQGNHSDLLALLPYPQQLRRLHVPECASLSQEVLNLFTGLEELNVSRTKISHVHFCSASLRRLYAQGCHALDNAGLANATRLEVLHVDSCSRVTSVQPFAATLVELHAEDSCGIGDTALVNATSIRRLFAQNNVNITTVKPFAASLVELDAWGCGITPKGLSDATSIVKLSVGGTFEGITTVAPFAGALREAFFCSSFMDDSGLRDATGLVKLSLWHCVQVRTVKPFASTLRELNMNNAILADDGLCDATGIVRLQKGTGPLITLKPFAASLLDLSTVGPYITDEGFAHATSLVKLHVSGNSIVTTVAPCAATLRELRMDGKLGIRVEDVLQQSPGIGRLITDSKTSSLPPTVWRD